MPLGNDLMCTDIHPIKATNLAVDIAKSNKIAIENSKTGKMTTVVAIMKVLRSKIGNSRNILEKC